MTEPDLPPATSDDFVAMRIKSIEVVAIQLDAAFEVYCDAVKKHRAYRVAVDVNVANARMLAAARALVAILEGP